MKKNLGLSRTCMAFFVLAVVTNCQSSGLIDVNAQSSPDDGAYGSPTSTIVGNTVSELEINNSEIRFNVAAGGDKDIALMLVAYGPANAPAQSFAIDAAQNEAPDLSVAARFSVPEPEPDPADATAAFHDDLRLIEEDLDPEAVLNTGESRFAVRALEVGDFRSFKTVNGFNGGGFSVVNAQLIYSGPAFDLYVDERDLNAILPQEMDKTIQVFDKAIPAEQDLFGRESDVDGDGKFNILMTHAVNALGENYGGLVTGYFYAADLFAENAYPMSNMTEVIYTLVPDPEGVHGPKVPYRIAMENILPGVLVHEYQHMINFNQHYFRGDKGSEANWLNEGLSHLAEDIFTLDTEGYMEGSGLENPSRVARYLDDVQRICFTCGSRLEQRGGAYLFLRYLYEQAQQGQFANLLEGRDFIARLMDGTHRDVFNISYALTGDGSLKLPFEKAMARFGLSLYFSGTGLTTDPSLEIQGLNLRSVQDDNRGTFLNGPAIVQAVDFPHLQTLTGNTLSFVQIPAEKINAAGGDLRLTVSDGSRFRAYLLQ